MKFTAPYCVNHMFRFLASFRHFPVTFPSLSSNFWGPDLVVSWLEDRRCNLHYIDQPIYFPSWLPSLDCQMRHKVPNLQSIYLLKMYRNPFTHFLIAGEAHAKCRCCAILAIPSMTILIAEDEAQSAELVTQMHNPTFYNPFDCRGWGTKCRIRSGHTLFMLFFSYFPKPFCLSDLFPAYHLVTRMRKIYSLFSYI